MLRKQIIGGRVVTPAHHPDEIDIVATATVSVTSEAAQHPIDNAFDDSRGPGGSRWVAGGPGEQTLIVAFDSPRMIGHITLEVEEREVARQQVIWVSVSSDGGRTYRELLRQEYVFSPPGTTFEREEWTVREEEVTHLQLVIKPDKGGKPCQATLVSLALR
jgi:hypothetical protein